MIYQHSHRMGNILKIVAVAALMFCGKIGLLAETFMENCDRRPTVNGWLYLGDRSSCTWNENGWMDMKPVKKASRLFRQLQSPLKKGQKFYFEYDLMVPLGVEADSFYAGIMTPDGDTFNNFIGVYLDKNSFMPALVKNSGAGDMIKGEGKAIAAPLIVRVVGEFDGVDKIKIKVLDLLKKMEPLASSEVTVDLNDVNLAMMTVFGIGMRPAKTANAVPFRVDNIYFSDREPNAGTIMPSFMGFDLVKVSNIVPISNLKGVRVIAEIDSIIDADQVEVKGSILPDKKLRGDEIWTGMLGKVKLVKGGKSTVELEIGNLDPALWFPDSPSLYNLNVTVIFNGKVISTGSTRFGFRVFEAKDGRFYLNGRPIFLRGCSLNPPAPNVLDKIGQKPSFINDYLRDLKLRNINIIRMFSQDYNELKRWMDACDEMGIMVFQGCYGNPPGGTDTQPSKDINKSLQIYNDQFFGNYATHPSVVIYILASDVARTGNERAVYDAWFNRVCKKIKKWNPSVAIMADSGVESCTAGDITDSHFYAGWYYGSFLDYLNFRKPIEGVESIKDRPQTVSECVGAFTTEKNGFPVHGRQIAAGLTWGGNEAGNSRIALRYQAFLTKQAIEQFRRLREYNPHLAGIMPYTPLYANWQKVRIFSEMKAKPAADQMRVSFQPVLISWESWTPHAYSGTEFSTVVHVVNDSDTGDDLTRATVVWELVHSSGTVVTSGKEEVPLVKYYQSKSFPITVKLDAKLEAGTYRLRGNLKLGGKLLASNETMIFLAGKDWVTKGQADNSAVRIFDPSEKLKTVFGKLGVKFAEVQNFSSLREGNVLVIGEGIDLAALREEKETISKFISGGGRVVVFFPTDELLDFLGIAGKVKVVPFEAKDGVFINQAREDNLIFSKLPDSALFFWNDYTDWNESKPGFPQISPLTTAMSLKTQESLKDIAVIANFGRGLSNAALLEVFNGEGTVLLSGFDFLTRVGKDPVADRMLLNLITYACSKKKHFLAVEASERIQWGNFKSENGVIVGPVNGLVPFGVKTGRMESPAGPEYIAHGRELVGPFHFISGGEIFYRGGQDSPGKAVFLARMPKGRTRIITVVRNPFPETVNLSIQVGSSPPRAFKLPGNRTIPLNCLIPHGTDEMMVIFRGRRGLILEETQFE